MTASDALVPAVDAPADRIAGSGLGTPSAERSAICLATTTYRTVRSVDGPLLFVEAVRGVGLGELVSIGLPDGRTRDGQVLEVREGLVVVQTFSGTEGIDVRQTRVRFLGAPARAAVGRDMLGRSFDGLGRPIDGGPPCLPESLDDVNGLPMNPVARDQPNEFIQTGVSAIDGLDTLVRGQKLPIFSAFGLPGNDLAAQIATNARVEGGQPFAVVFGAVGITHRESAFFRSALQQAGAMQRTVLFVNLADDPTLERLLTPRFALTAAEHLAFRCGMHVLVILTDMTNYCEALRELAAAREEVPGRRGYPGYMYTDLASLYERAGRIRGRSGSITQVTILSMPDDDMTHPIPDLTGYITEGQIVLSRDLHRRGIEPPIDPLPCLSRLMDQGIGAGKTREDHRQLADQLYAAYASGRSLRRMEAILGESALSPLDRRYLAFADAFETQFVGQGAKGRTVGETLDLGWKLLGHLPRAELKHVRPDQIERYWQQMDDGAPPGASVSESRAPDS